MIHVVAISNGGGTISVYAIPADEFSMDAMESELRWVGRAYGAPSHISRSENKITARFNAGFVLTAIVNKSVNIGFTTF